MLMRFEHLPREIQRARHHDAHGAARLIAAFRECRLKAGGGIGGDALPVGDVREILGAIGVRLARNLNRGRKLGQPLEMAQETAGILGGQHADDEMDGAWHALLKIGERARHRFTRGRVMPSVHPNFGVGRRQLMQLAGRQALQPRGPDRRCEALGDGLFRNVEAFEPARGGDRGAGIST